MQYTSQINRPLPSSKNPHFQNEATCTTFLVKMSFFLDENEKWFPYQRLSTYPRFETEAHGNLEMAYSGFYQTAHLHLSYPNISP